MVLVAPLAPAEARTRQPCVDGVDCYCDCVEDTPGTGPNDSGFASTYCKQQNIPIDPELLWCEDFEDPTFESPDNKVNNWKQVYGAGSTPCIDSNNDGMHEGGAHGCRNMLQNPARACERIAEGGNRPNSVDGFSDFDYEAGNPDLNESGGHSTLDATWDGCQTWGFPFKENRNGGQATGLIRFPKAAPTISHTMMMKFSSNHFIGNQKYPNVKGDRYHTDTPLGAFSNFINSKHAVPSGPDSCTVGSLDPLFGFPGSNKYPFASLLKATPAQQSQPQGGILNKGACCSAGCFSDDVGPSGPRIGVEFHHPSETSKGVRYMMPPRSLWNPGVPGGVPMSVEGNKDGRDEWLCMQWTVQNHGTNNMNYYFWVNGVQIMRFENIKGANDQSPFMGVKWLHLSTSGLDAETMKNTTGEDQWQVRDNYHLSASATPPSCTQVGFDGLPQLPPPPDPSGPPNRPFQLQP